MSLPVPFLKASAEIYSLQLQQAQFFEDGHLLNRLQRLQRTVLHPFRTKLEFSYIHINKDTRLTSDQPKQN